MSNIYVQEPPTNGKVMLKTSFGDLDVELWSREAPRACRNFVQLCMEGYYDDTIFHRVIKEFIIQGGDPTGTGDGGESIYGSPFKDEFHSRLRFAARGVLAMAHSNNANGSQFFITLAPALEELQGKHTIFGKLAGDTKFNILRVADMMVENEKFVYEQKIIKAEVLVNPFPDIVPRNLTLEVKKDDVTVETEEKNKLAIKQYSLLSFGDEAEQDDIEVSSMNKLYSQKEKYDPHSIAATGDSYVIQKPKVENEKGAGNPENSLDEDKLKCSSGLESDKRETKEGKEEAKKELETDGGIEKLGERSHDSKEGHERNKKYFRRWDDSSDGSYTDESVEKSCKAKLRKCMSPPRRSRKNKKSRRSKERSRDRAKRNKKAPRKRDLSEGSYTDESIEKSCKAKRRKCVSPPRRSKKEKRRRGSKGREERSKDDDTSKRRGNSTKKRSDSTSRSKEGSKWGKGNRRSRSGSASECGNKEANSSESKCQRSVASDVKRITDSDMKMEEAGNKGLDIDKTTFMANFIQDCEKFQKKKELPKGKAGESSIMTMMQRFNEKRKEASGTDDDWMKHKMECPKEEEEKDDVYSIIDPCATLAKERMDGAKKSLKKNQKC